MEEGKANEAASGVQMPYKWSLVLCAIWLDAIVVAFVIVQLNRVNTPMAEWANKIAALLLGR